MQEVGAVGGFRGWMQEVDAGGGCRRRMQGVDAGGWMQRVDARCGCRGWMQEVDAGGGCRGVDAGGVQVDPPRLVASLGDRRRENRPRGAPRRPRGDLGDPPPNLGEPRKKQAAALVKSAAGFGPEIQFSHLSLAISLISAWCPPKRGFVWENSKHAK